MFELPSRGAVSDDQRSKPCRVRVEGVEQGQWLASDAATSLTWTYANRLEGAGVWPPREAAGLANAFRRSFAWRGRQAFVEPID